MTWTIEMNPLNNLALSALVAAIPILYLFWALAYKRMKGHWAALSAVAIAIVISIFVYGMPVKYSLLSTLYGMLFGLWPVCWIVITAVFIYNLSVKTGEFDIIKNSLATISDARRMQALLIAFSFGAFIEGAAGFQSPLCRRHLPSGKHGAGCLWRHRHPYCCWRPGLRCRPDGIKPDGRKTTPFHQHSHSHVYGNLDERVEKGHGGMACCIREWRIICFGAMVYLKLYRPSAS